MLSNSGSIFLATIVILFIFCQIGKYRNDGLIYKQQAFNLLI